MTATDDLHVADLDASLPYADAEFDDVVAPLVLHDLEDWSGPLAELRRVLKPGGRPILSVNHTGAYAIVYPEADYFAVTRCSQDCIMSGQAVWLTFSEPPPPPDTPPKLLPLTWKAGHSCASCSSSSRRSETELRRTKGLGERWLS